MNVSKTFSNNNNTTGPQLTTNVVSVMQCIFSLLGTTELALTGTCFKAIKAAFAFEFTFERICRLKFAFDEYKF